MSAAWTCFDEDDDGVTQCNIWARLYFEPGRSRLMFADGFFDFSKMRDRAYAMAWCKSNGVEFFDHRPELLPECLREQVRVARGRGAGELRELKSKWRLVPLGVLKGMFVPELTTITSWRDARAQELPNAAPLKSPAPRYWPNPRIPSRSHAFTCPCFVCRPPR